MFPETLCCSENLLPKVPGGRVCVSDAAGPVGEVTVLPGECGCPRTGVWNGPVTAAIPLPDVWNGLGGGVWFMGTVWKGLLAKAGLTGGAANMGSTCRSPPDAGRATCDGPNGPMPMEPSCVDTTTPVDASIAIAF